jgi:hypothetical protein
MNEKSSDGCWIDRWTDFDQQMVQAGIGILCDWNFAALAVEDYGRSAEVKGTVSKR